VDGYLTFLNSILEEEELAKGDCSLENLQIENSRQSEKQYREKQKSQNKSKSEAILFYFIFVKPITKFFCIILFMYQ